MTLPPETLSPFGLLVDPPPGGYIACSWDLGRDEPARIHWVNFFRAHFRTLLKLAMHELRAAGISEESASRACLAAATELDSLLAAYAVDPLSSRWGPRVTILTLDRWRDAILRRYDIRDAFATLKRRENEAALPQLGVDWRDDRDV